VRKRHFLSHLYIKVIFLPRQARDKHRENSKKVPFSRRRFRTVDGQGGDCAARTTAKGQAHSAADRVFRHFQVRFAVARERSTYHPPLGKRLRASDAAGRACRSVDSFIGVRVSQLIVLSSCSPAQKVWRLRVEERLSLPCLPASASRMQAKHVVRKPRRGAARPRMTVGHVSCLTVWRRVSCRNVSNLKDFRYSSRACLGKYSVFSTKDVSVRTVIEELVPLRAERFPVGGRPKPIHTVKTASDHREGGAHCSAPTAGEPKARSCL
jgi:hypothetical protein